MDKTSSSTSTVVSIDGGTLSSLLFKLKNSHGDAVSLPRVQCIRYRHTRDLTSYLDYTLYSSHIFYSSLTGGFPGGGGVQTPF